MKNKFLILAAFFFLISCAHHKDVRPGADGVHKVVVVSEDTEKGTRNAISQAEHYCKESERHAAFINEDKKYTGDMSEEDYKKGKRIAKVAQAAGGAVWVFGGQQEKNLGGIVGLGGSVADQAIGKGYTVEMKFQCQ